MKYRPDIDGLRTVAVLPVVLFHAGLPGIDGGFIGVDVFFVISGFLITSIIHREAVENRFSFSGFYERRLRRIMPALLAVIAFVVAGSILLLLPSDLSNLPSQVVGSVFFAANIVLWREAGYFAPAAEELPLLHIWSLGVEEQFYIFAPVVLLLVLRVAPRLLKPVLVLVTLMSFGLSMLYSEAKPDFAFYLLPTRAWELGAGALIAIGVLSRPSNRLMCESLTSFGLCLILVGVVLIDSSMPFPGWVAAVPVVGATLVILCGQGTRTGTLLGWAPIRGIGLISYSLYLWHWPLIVFADYRGWLDGTASRVGIVMLSFVAAWLSWRLIEMPFRDRTRFGRKHILSGSAVGMALMTVVAIGIDRTEGWQGRWSDENLTFAAASDDISPERARCHRLSGIGPIEKTCILGEGTPATAVWSDSHGVELSYAIGELIPVRQISYSSCDAAMQMDRPRSPACQEHNNHVLEYLTDPASGIKTVILAAFFESMLEKPGFRAGFAETVDRLTEAGLRVIVVAQLPRPGYAVPTHLARGRERTFPFAMFEANHTAMMDYLGTLRSAKVFDPAPLICSGADCNLVVDGHPILFDHHHPSMSMARTIAGALLEETIEMGSP
jgi:peptidoglycan/LPS O-acetylase OafA/YrhL